MRTAHRFMWFQSLRWCMSAFEEFYVVADFHQSNTWGRVVKRYHGGLSISVRLISFCHRVKLLTEEIVFVVSDGVINFRNLKQFCAIWVGSRIFLAINSARHLRCVLWLGILIGQTVHWGRWLYDAVRLCVVRSIIPQNRRLEKIWQLPHWFNSSCRFGE